MIMVYISHVVPGFILRQLSDFFWTGGGIWGICCKIDKPGWEACERAEHGGVEGALV